MHFTAIDGTTYSLPPVNESLFLNGMLLIKNFAKAFESCNKKRATTITVSVVKQAIKRFARMCTQGDSSKLEGEFLKQVWEPSTLTRPLLI
jgi:hypothetical protein